VHGKTSLLTKNGLAKLRQKAVRAGVWYRSLPRIDRVLVDLTIRVAECIRSSQLARSIGAVVGKLEEVLESKISKLTRTIGWSLAEKVSALAQSWGYTKAETWVSSRQFAVYLAVMEANK